MSYQYSDGMFWDYVNDPGLLEKKVEKKEKAKEEKKLDVKKEESFEEDEKAPDSRKFMLEFMKKKKIEGKLIFSMISGSWCYGLNLPESDFDFLGVYVAPTRDVLSLKRLKTTHHQKDPDVILYEIVDFANILMKGNPLLLQMLYAPHYISSTKEFDELKKHKHLYVTEKSVKAYFGYHEAELRQITKKVSNGYNKCLFHSFRLLFEIDSILNNGGPIIYFSNTSCPEQFKFMMNIRTEEESEDKRKKYLTEVDKKKTELKELEKKILSLPDNQKFLLPSMKESENPKGFRILDSWVLNLRKAHF